MKEKYEALRLADWLDAEACGGSNWNAKMNAAAAELRRLSAVEAQRDALLEALKDLMQQYKDQPECFMDWSKARAAIKAVEGEKT